MPYYTIRSANLGLRWIIGMGVAALTTISVCIEQERLIAERAQAVMAMQKPSILQMPSSRRL